MYTIHINEYTIQSINSGYVRALKLTNIASVLRNLFPDLSRGNSLSFFEESMEVGCFFEA